GALGAGQGPPPGACHHGRVGCVRHAACFAPGEAIGGSSVHGSGPRRPVPASGVWLPPGPAVPSLLQRVLPERGARRGERERPDGSRGSLRLRTPGLHGGARRRGPTGPGLKRSNALQNLRGRRAQRRIPMTQALRVDTPDVSQLEERLRSSLRQARGNLEIRNQLIRLARDPERFEALRRELGPTHALILELRALDPDADREPKKALAEER